MPYPSDDGRGEADDCDQYERNAVPALDIVIRWRASYQFEEHDNQHSHGQLHKVEPGDTVWIVTVRPPGHPSLLGRIVVGIVTDYEGPKEFFHSEDIRQAPWHIIAQAGTERLLAETEQERENIQSQIALAEGSELVPEQVIKTGLAVLQDMGTFREKADLTMRQRLQRFLFPEGIPFAESGLEPCKTAFCIQQKAVISMTENTMVAPRRIELLFGD